MLFFRGAFSMLRENPAAFFSSILSMAATFFASGSLDPTTIAVLASMVNVPIPSRRTAGCGMMEMRLFCEKAVAAIVKKTAKIRAFFMYGGLKWKDK